MRYISLGKQRGRKSSAYRAIVDNDDYRTLSKLNWHYCHGYAVRNGGKGKNLVYMHKVVLGLDSALQGDHVNGNKLDNRKRNLRPASHRQNHRNKPKMSVPTTSRYKGVSWITAKAKWVAQIRVDGKHYALGGFDEERWAALVYDMAAKTLHKDFASLNFPTAIHGGLL